MDGNEPKSDYARMLDEAVREIKQSEERRLEYMSIYANVADERDLGEYRGIAVRLRRACSPGHREAGKLDFRLLQSDSEYYSALPCNSERRLLNSAIWVCKFSFSFFISEMRPSLSAS